VGDFFQLFFPSFFPFFSPFTPTNEMSRKRKVVEEGEDFLQREASISQVRAEVQQQKAREDKEAKKKARKVEIEGLVNRFLIEGFEVVKEPLVPVPQSCLFPLGKPDRRQITTAVARDEWKIFMKILPKSFFEMIADSTNANMQAKKASGQIDKQTFRKYCKESVTARDILNVFALLQYFRIEVGEASLAQKFKKDPPYGMKAWPMSRERFTAITSSLDADLDALRALLTTTWAKCVNPASVFAMDEGLFAFYSRLHNTPMRYIPRKPHKNGLLAYIAAFKLTSGVPYVFDIALDTEINDPLKGREVLLQFLQRWPWEAVNPFVVVDAGFSGEEMTETLLAQEMYFMMSINRQHKRDLFDLMDRCCPVGHAVNVKDERGVVWSAYKSPLNTLFTASNGFKPQGSGRPVQSSFVLSDSDRSLITKLSQKTLFRLANHMKVRWPQSQMSVADAVCHYLADPAVNLHEAQSHEEEEEGEEEDEKDEEAADEEEEDAEEENSAESEVLLLIPNFFLSNSQSTS